MDRLWNPIIEQFKPDVALMSLGVDCHYMDPLTGLVLTSEGIVKTVEGLMSLTRKMTGKGTSVLLEGGYNMDALAEVYGALICEQKSYEFTKNYDENCNGSEYIDATVDHQSRFWDL